MRTIKFKAKRINNGDWVVGSLAIYGKRAYILPEKNMWQPLVVFKKVDPATVCQFTGVTDKNGKEVPQFGISHLLNVSFIVLIQVRKSLSAHVRCADV